MSQMALPLDWTGAKGLSGDFLVSACNAEAVRHLEHSATWPVRTSILTGPARSGRSLLGRLFALATGGTVVDTVAGQSDDSLFHAWNRAQETRLPLLLIADAPPSEWNVTLPDLKSRLGAAPVVHIDQPDDNLIAPLIERLFLDRGTRISEDLPGYLAPRIERSYAAIHQTVTNLDEAALADHKRISVPFARQFFAGRDAPGLPGLEPPPFDPTGD
ncbi:chromosomal replication initiator DnaA [Pseudonocardia sp. TMWB2A]|uniref:HdaA/DnaA family protein n=1 Tax=Pseudonocardia sp. TMWB2A TaxID=687430 RepID=UPI00307CFD7D